RSRCTSREIFGVRDFLSTGFGAQRFEAGAIVELETRRAHCATHEFRAREQIEPAGASDLRAGACEFLLGELRVAREVVPLVLRESAARAELPIRRRRTSGARGEKYRHGADHARSHGSEIPVSRWNGHLRFISSTRREILRMLSSTSARNCPRSAVALDPTLCASASTASSFFMLPRTSANSASAWTTALRVSSSTPPSPSTRRSVFASSASRRDVVRSSDASSVFARSIVPITLATCSSLPSSAPSTPCWPLIRSLSFCRLANVLCTLPPAEVSRSTFSR